jgi:hypothetical protein
MIFPRSPWRRDRIAGGIDHETIFRVTGAYASHISDVMG